MMGRKDLTCSLFVVAVKTEAAHEQKLRRTEADMQTKLGRVERELEEVLREKQVFQDQIDALRQEANDAVEKAEVLDEQLTSALEERIIIQVRGRESLSESSCNGAAGQEGVRA